MTDAEDERGEMLRFTSSGERLRRTEAFRELMEREELAALVVCARSDIRYRGRVFYASDVWQLSGDTFTILARDRDPIFVNETLLGAWQAHLTDWVGDVQTSSEPGRQVGEILGDLGFGRSDIGVVGLSDALSVQYWNEMQAAAPDARFRDATRAFDEVRQVKSEEELTNLRETSAIFRKVFADLEPAIRPGVTEMDIAGEAQRLLQQQGVFIVQVVVQTAPFTQRIFGRSQGNRPIGRDDPVMVWLEGWGPSGYALELRRCYTFGPPPDDLKRFWELQVEAVAAGVAAMKPGGRAGDFVPAFAHAVKQARYTARLDFSRGDLQYYLHGIGTDVIEAMWIPGKDRLLQKSEVVNVHPSVGFPTRAEARKFAWLGVTDSFVITDRGGVPMTYERSELITL